MRFIDKPLVKREIELLKQEYGDYLKVTVDLEKEVLVAGCQLHADGEKVLLDKGSNQDQIWGGGIDLKAKEIDTTAVLNLRPRLGNNSLEILAANRRERLINITKSLFKVLWD